MNKIVLVLSSMFVCLWTSVSMAEDVDFGIEDINVNNELENSKVVSENTDNQEEKSEEIKNEVKSKAEYDKEISFYIQNMKLSVEQLDMAKYISDDSRLKQEQLLKSIYLLRKQARELEAKSLSDFEAILTEEQKVIFEKLKDLQHEQRIVFDKIGLSDEEIEEGAEENKEVENVE